MGINDHVPRSDGDGRDSETAPDSEREGNAENTDDACTADARAAAKGEAAQPKRPPCAVCELEAVHGDHIVGWRINQYIWTEIMARLHNRLQKKPLDRPLPEYREETSRGGTSLSDIVHDIVTREISAWRDGSPIPQTLAELERILLTKAEKRRRAVNKVDRERRRNAELFSRNATAEDMFSVICARDEQKQFFELLYAKVDAECQVFMEAVLVEGLPITAPAFIAEFIGTSVRDIEKRRRRMETQACKIMAQLTMVSKDGGTA